MKAWLRLSALLLFASTVAAQPSNYWDILHVDRMAFRMRTVAVLPQTGSGSSVQMVYGDVYSILRVVEIGDGAARELWRSRTLEGPVLEVLVEDLDGDNRPEILARTQNGKLYVFDDQYNVLWESQSSEYSSIEAMAIANMDTDFPYEIVLLSSGYLNYIDGSTFQREYRSNLSYRGTEIAVGNVDTDPQLEVVFNTGKVIDVESGDSDWDAQVFGTYIELLDVDGDGLAEIIGYTEGQPMRIFDADERQEKPLR